jgi:phosphoglycerate dehydrogenase-like enzyme
MLDAAFFKAMKPTAYYISVGRGATTVTDDLAAALRAGEIAGAGLDVTDPEPLPEGHPLWTAPRVLISPHTASRSDGGRERLFLLLRENLRRYAAGEPLLSVVDIERGY